MGLKLNDVAPLTGQPVEQATAAPGERRELKDGRVRLSLACSCDNSIEITSSNLAVIDGVAQCFLEAHTGDGHSIK